MVIKPDGLKGESYFNYPHYKQIRVMTHFRAHANLFAGGKFIKMLCKTVYNVILMIIELKFFQAVLQNSSING